MNRDLMAIQLTVSDQADPSGAQAYRLSGIGLLSESDWAGAITAFTQSLKLNKNQADVYLLRGFALLKQATPDTDGALNDFDQAILLEAKQISALYMSAHLRNQKWTDEKIKTRVDELKKVTDAKTTAKTKLDKETAALKDAQDAADAQQKKVDDAKSSADRAQTDLNGKQTNLDTANANYRRVIDDPNDKDQKNLDRAKAILKDEKEKVDNAIKALKEYKETEDKENKELTKKNAEVTKQKKVVDTATTDSEKAGTEVQNKTAKITAAVQDLQLAVQNFKTVISLDPNRKAKVDPEIEKANKKIKDLSPN